MNLLFSGFEGYDEEQMLIASAKIPERKGSISPFSFYGRLPDY